MIIDMPNTHTSEIAQKIDELHEERGEAATGRVLTLLILTRDHNLEEALETANAASREHPCRVIAIVPDASSDIDPDKDDSNLSAQVRFGADAGAGEIIILRPRNGLVRHQDTLVIPLLVPDAPIVAWWPTNPPASPSKDPIGAMARSRITDAMNSDNPEATMERLRGNLDTADVDLSWTRLTVWRAMLASMLDQPPHLPILKATVSGPKNFLPLDLLRAWLRLRLDVPVELKTVDDATAITAVHLEREDGELSLVRPDDNQAMVSFPGQAPQPISMPIRSDEDCLSEELRRLEPDDVYGEVINTGWNLLYS
ncbi:glucose-6-phosphate dehydrogenase assembly protein OpcA [Bifidobacterium mongoliense]|jgi:glucose-6-phosphate dehydrogenase assembly protein OpcA|uniref:glucose-6-phosphate dehydrogenase assembly protein OpcA n=2 Tax=Bifidobacterium mongoliense TaxID=518643 RepID=UPI002648B4A0|nr:glucose-6-phosphate dehydrogenase assembly protein OpcA [Bifidobacterium mongoliense]MDN6017310.1 glucose-6-phosphate dehydrogenase assembly protein OpcA [Bifidobacterium mongoliense]MDN6553511.1 glucose-6-phosphate dehydrogenase assembly protein OpcA [Bifidobacterium mongoliense]MDN6768457.1 glucose-6-phosphate dehydrogenase assembly protein OpcA [Bifidobacterium mongoliense]MDN6783209.1 glucose-6-phosphate dehydrogenase assembly protein OpcA [Bifidobacterium mongoliense]MDN6802301.1 gluco